MRDFRKIRSATALAVAVFSVAWGAACGGDPPPPVASPSPTATPTPSPTPDPVLLAAGDIACGTTTGSAPCQYFRTAALLEGYTVVLALGDLQYEVGDYQEFLKFYDPAWGRAKDSTRPVPGNHEYLTAGAKGYFDYFDGPTFNTGPAGDRDKGYYSYDIGSWHLVALNSNCASVRGCGAGSPQEVWLRVDLGAHRNTCTLAYWHHPRFSSGQNGSDLAVQPLWQALYDFKADVVLNGHDHDFERFAPQTPQGVADPDNGIRQFVVGTGGRNLTRIGTPIANSEVRDDSTFGVIKMALHSTSYDWQFLPIDPSVIGDKGSGRCH